MAKNKKSVRAFFNMVEVTLSLAVVGIGIAGIMSLFPVAVQQSRDSIGDNSAPDIAEQFMTYIQMKCNNDTAWNQDGVSNTGFVANMQGVTTKPDSDGSTELGLNTSNAWTNVADTNIQTSGTNGLYRVDLTSGAGIIDFSAAVRVWTKSIGNLFIGGKQETMLPKYGFALYVEVSWPTGKPYAQREKREYYMDVFNSNPL